MWQCRSPECECEKHHRSCLEGVRPSAEQLIQTLTPMVAAVIRKKLPYSQAADRQEVWQDTFHSVFKNLGAWRGDGQGRFCDWVKMIAIRAAYTRGRVEQRLNQIGWDSKKTDEIVASRDPLTPEVWKCVERTLNQLPKDLRLVYELHTKQGKTVKETAEIMGIQERAVYYKLERVKDRLLACLD